MKLVGALLLACLVAETAAQLALTPGGSGFWGLRYAEAAPPARSRFFPETGFTVSDREGVNLLAEFERLGGIRRLGFPVTRAFAAGGFLHQGFQRAILQWRPLTNSAVSVNIMDQLHELGRDDWLLSRGVPLHSTGDDGSGGNLDRARETRLTWLTNPTIQ